jgi:hypothetical protein
MSLSHHPRRAPAAHAAADEGDRLVRDALTRFLVATSREPSIADLAGATGLPPAGVRKSLMRLEAKRGLVLHPNRPRPWIVHPFSLSPTGCWVQGPERGWWAPCIYCAFGISLCVGQDVIVRTRHGGDADIVEYSVRAGRLEPTDDVFHFLTPARRWWDNVVFTCATFQPFRGEADVDRWCACHGFDRGFMISVERLFTFALDWYHPHASHWYPRSPGEVRECFSRHGLVGEFWNV